MSRTRRGVSPFTEEICGHSAVAMRQCGVVRVLQCVFTKQEASVVSTEGSGSGVVTEATDG